MTGELTYRESVVNGLEQVPKAFIRMLKGENFGKQLVKLAERSTPAYVTERIYCIPSCGGHTLVFLIFHGIDTNHRNSVGKNKTLRSKQNKEKEKFIL